MAIESISNLLNEINTDPTDLHYQRFFRGHGDSEYKFIPNVLREEKMIEYEHNIFNEVLVECPNDFKDCISNSERLVKMQHYGLVTRLLDITSNPLIALYFACNSKKDCDGTIIEFNVHSSHVKTYDSDSVSILSALSKLDKNSKDCLKNRALKFTNGITLGPSEIKEFNNIDDPDNEIIAWLLHEIKKEKPAFENVINPHDLLNSCVFRPQKLNDRIVRQNGLFILYGLNYDPDTKNPPINLSFNRKELSTGESNTILASKSITMKIPKEKKESILKELDILGITEAYIYPELYKVSEFINKKYASGS